MATERLAPDAILAQTNLSGSVSAIQDDPDAPNASWLTCPDNTSNTSVTVSMPTPSGTLTGTQNVRALIRPTSAGSNAGSASVDVLQGGVVIASSSTVTVSAQQVIDLSFSSALVSDASAVEVRVNGTSASGKASNRKSVEVGAVEWNAEYSLVSGATAAASRLTLAVATRTATAASGAIATANRQSLTVGLPSIEFRTTNYCGGTIGEDIALPGWIQPGGKPDLNLSVAAGKLSASLSQQSATVTAGASVAPTALDLSLTQAGATVTTGATIAASALDVAVTQHGASVVTGASVAVSPLDLALAQHIASASVVSGSAIANAGKQATTLSVLAAAANGSAETAMAVLAASIVLRSASVTTDATVAVSRLQASLTLYAATAAVPVSGTATLSDGVTATTVIVDAAQTASVTDTAYYQAIVTDEGAA